MKLFVASAMLLSALMVVQAKGADSLDAKVTLTQGYNTFDEAVARLEKATGWRISCPADTAKVMLAIWKREQFPSRKQDDFFLKTPRAVKEVLDSVCEDLGLTWKHREADQTVLIDVPWRATDSRPAADLLQAIWKPGHESEFIKNEEWWRALDALLSKEENFALACRVRQRAMMESMFRIRPSERDLEPPLQTWTEVSVVSRSGARYQCLFNVRSLQISPGHGWMSYYCFDDRGTLKIADVVNTGHRKRVDRLAVYPRGADGAGASDIELAVQPLANYSEPRSVHFVMEDDGLKVVDSSGAGESLLKPAK